MISDDLRKRFDELSVAAPNCTGKKRDELNRVLYQICAQDPPEALRLWRKLTFDNITLIDDEMSREKIRPMYLGPHLIPWRDSHLLSENIFIPAIPLLTADDEFLDVLFCRYPLDYCPCYLEVVYHLKRLEFAEAEKYLTRLYNRKVNAGIGGMWNTVSSYLLLAKEFEVRDKTTLETKTVLPEELQRFLRKWIGAIDDENEKANAVCKLLGIVPGLSAGIEDDLESADNVEMEIIRSVRILLHRTKVNTYEILGLLEKLINLNSSLGLKMLKSALKELNYPDSASLAWYFDSRVLSCNKHSLVFHEESLTPVMKHVLSDDELMRLLFSGNPHRTIGGGLLAACLQDREYEKAQRVLEYIYANPDYSWTYEYKQYGKTETAKSCGFDLLWKSVFELLDSSNNCYFQEESLIFDHKAASFVHLWINNIPIEDEKLIARQQANSFFYIADEHKYKNQLINDIETSLLNKTPDGSTIIKALDVITPTDKEIGYSIFIRSIKIFEETNQPSGIYQLANCMEKPWFKTCLDNLLMDEGILDALVRSSNPFTFALPVAYLLDSYRFEDCSLILSSLYQNANLYATLDKVQSMAECFWDKVLRILFGGEANNYNSGTYLKGYESPVIPQPAVRKEIYRWIMRISNEDIREKILLWVREEMNDE